MFKSQNRNSQIFVDYIPAELKESKTWIIVYYVKNPITKKLVRKRNRVKPLKSISARRKLAKQMVARINEQLSNGWNPFFEDTDSKQYKKLEDAFNLFINRKKVELKDENLRSDTFRTYNSRLTVFKNYLSISYERELFCFELNKEIILDFLDHIRYTKKNSAKTRDNYLSFLVTLCNFLLEKNYLKENPCLSISKSNRKIKTRKLIPIETRSKIFTYLYHNNKEYLTLCLLCYFCFIRRTEITKLKTKDFNLEKNIITIQGETSKNRKTQIVTIPQSLTIYLKIHLKHAKQSNFVFSSENFKPGNKKLNPDRITKQWIKMRETIGIPKEIQWYSLKDTGITELLRNGAPVISVRDQARHHSSKETDTYTPKELMFADPNILKSNVNFKTE